MSAGESGLQLADVIRQAVESVLSAVHTCLPAQIETYDADKCKATVKPDLKKWLLDGEFRELPIITNVPVQWPRSSKGILHFPLEKGDYCLLVFSERSLEGWLQKGGVAEPGSRRKFDMNDAVAIPGVAPFNQSSGASSSDFELKFGDSSLVIESGGDVRLSGGKVYINGNNLTVEAQ